MKLSEKIITNIDRSFDQFSIFFPRNWSKTDRMVDDRAIIDRSITDHPTIFCEKLIEWSMIGRPISFFDRTITWSSDLWSKNGRSITIIFGFFGRWSTIVRSIFQKNDRMIDDRSIKKKFGRLDQLIVRSLVDFGRFLATTITSTTINDLWRSLPISLVGNTFPNM